MKNLKTAHIVNRFITRSLYSMHNRKARKVQNTSLSVRPPASSQPKTPGRISMKFDTNVVPRDDS